MLYNLIVGLIIGIGLIMPGVSGGVIAVILNVYDKIVFSLNNILKRPKESLKLLIPIVIGASIGVVFVGKIIQYLLFEKNYNQVYFVFIGLILGSIPSLMNNIKEKHKPNYLLKFISFSLSLLLFIFGKNIVNLSIIDNTNAQSFIYLFLTGLIFSIGKVVPGISSSFLLMLVGTYEYFLYLITNPINTISNNFMDFIYLLLVIVFGVIILVKLMNYLLKKHYVGTYSIIIGFVIGSIYAIYPGISLDINGIVSILILIISFLFSYMFTIKKKQ